MPHRYASLARPAAILSLAATLGLAACGGGNTTPTPTVAPTTAPTVAPTATTARTSTAAAVATATTAAPATATRPSGGTTTAATATRPGPGGTPGTPGSATANPTAVTGAYAALQRQPSYHLEIKVEGLGTIAPALLGNSLTYTIDAYGQDQKIVIDDGTGVRQEAYRVGGKFYTVSNGQVSEVTSLPLLYTLPDLLYTSLTGPGVMTFTAAGSEQVNGRTATKFNGTGSVAGLAANPLFAVAIPNARGTVNGPIWVDGSGNFLVAADLTINLTAPSTGTARMRLDVTRVGQGSPISAPR